MSENVLVSVLCPAYNHEKYIRKCLDGFIMQKTNFAFEVIINDDASTDNTAQIIREYENKYPDIIKPIYQTENQYSKGLSISKNFLYPKANGKYIAMCEGDDYWLDSEKLQKQVDALQEHPDCFICMGKTVCCAEDGTMIDKAYPSFILNTGTITSDAFLHKFAQTHFVHYCSYLFDAERMRQDFSPNNLNEWPVNAVFGDAFLSMICATFGNLYYIDEALSCHRMASADGWTERINKAGTDAKIKRAMTNIGRVEEIDRFSEYRFHEAFSEWCFNKYCFIADLNGDFKILLEGENKKILKRTRSKRFQIRVYLSIMFPHVVPYIIKKIYKMRGIEIGKI